MLLTETKILDKLYLHNLLRYDDVWSQVVGTADIVAKGGVGLVVRKRQEGWSVELTRFHGPNMVSCEIVSGWHHTLLVGMYLPPSTLNRLLVLEEALNRFPGRNSIAIGYFNVDSVRLQNPWSQQVVGFLAYFGMVNLLSTFKQRLCFLRMKTCWQVQQDIFLCSGCNYILGLDLRMF